MAAAAAVKPLLAPKAWPARRGGFHEDLIPILSLESFTRVSMRRYRIVPVAMAAAAADGSPHANGGENPYEVIGVSSVARFDKLRASYKMRRKDAERNGDLASISRLDRAYDEIMMLQLSDRKHGRVSGSFQVPKDVKYADNRPIMPWGPRFTRSSIKDMLINAGISAVFTTWILIKRNAGWKPSQFLALVFVYRIFDKIKAFEPSTTPIFDEYGEDRNRGLRVGKRLFRSLALVFSCIAIACLGFTGIINLMEYHSRSIPAFVYKSQEPLITAATGVLLCIMASFYR